MQDQTSAAKFGNKVQQGLSGISETKLFYLNLVEKKKKTSKEKTEVDEYLPPIYLHLHTITWYI